MDRKNVLIILAVLLVVLAAVTSLLSWQTSTRRANENREYEKALADWDKKQLEKAAAPSGTTAPTGSSRPGY